jgi:TolA-binding protein
MEETEHITVAETSEGPGGTPGSGTPVTLPVVEILTGRGFITGKSGSGKSNSASVVAERLLDGGFGLLIVDIDGEYYGLKEEYEILHVGGDEECDIQVTTEHSEKLASLALDQNVPIILDMSSYLDEEEAEALLTAVARSLFAKAKKRKQPFLLLVEEVHEYIPEKGSVGECGKMLIKVGKRGRKHGLGICGISQRPADVKKDFITQCDWLLWHRLTWNNDTKVVRRILDGEYADAVEDLDDGEGFLMTDWAESVQRVQFYRKGTFDAGATPGLEDFERPDLKSVSDDLVSELQEITEDQQATESRIAELREELDRKNSRIAELEVELQDARDLSRLAEQFVDALLQNVEGAAPGRTERERMRSGSTPVVQPDDLATLDDVAPPTPTDGEWGAALDDADAPSPTVTDEEGGAGTVADLEPTDPETAADESSDGASEEEVFSAMIDAVGDDEEWTPGEDRGEDPDVWTAVDEHWPGNDNGAATDPASSPNSTAAANGTADANGAAEENSEFSAEKILSTLSGVTEGDPSASDADETSSARRDRELTAREEIEASIRIDAEVVTDSDEAGDAPGGSGSAESAAGDTSEEEPLIVRKLKADIAGMETKTRKMLSFYREFGPGTPLNAHFAAGGDGDRKRAYARNRVLRTTGVIEHAGRGHYDYRLREFLAGELGRHVAAETLDTYVEEIESTALEK